MRQAFGRPAFRWISLLAWGTIGTVLLPWGLWGKRPLPMQAAVVAGLMASYAVLCAKCTSMLTVTTVRTEMQLQHWEFWACLVLMLVLTAALMHMLNVALMSSTAVRTLATYESISMVAQIVVNGVFFDEFRSFDAGDYALFAGGVACVFAGVVALVRFGNATEAAIH
mmetsp:Transcript_66714/g.174917  ORF Transcript_66714/g.174917 Transcript_66714/m.174917 type:complete len:168 (+) Transcript_66714:2-505(+)